MADPRGSRPTPTVVVTGAAGYIGSRVVRELQREHPGWEVRCLDNFYLGDVRHIGDSSVEYVDVRNRERLADSLSGADIVLHLAALSDIDDCEENQDLAFEVNVQGTSNVAWFCRQTGAGLVFPFSMAVLGDPERFPIVTDLPRRPMNWYGRTKLLNEQTIETLSTGAFPAHLYLKSNLYGEHSVNGRPVSKGTVINFFVNRVFSDQPLTVYEPGTQSRNFVHVKDVARAYVRSAERLLYQLDDDETGVSKYEIASGEDPSVHEIAKRVQAIAAEVADIETSVELVENPRKNETLVSDFGVDTTKARTELQWETRHTIDDTIRNLIARKAETTAEPIPE